MKFLLLHLGLLIFFYAAGQQRELLLKKMSPNLMDFKTSLPNDTQRKFFIVARDLKELEHYLREKSLNKNISLEYPNSKLLVLNTSRRIIDSILLPSPLVDFIDISRTPKEETIIDGFDVSTNKVNLVHKEFASINGNGTVVSVKENRPDSNDIDLKNRLINSAILSSTITPHATIMSTIIAGAGNSFFTGKGVAWGADITGSDFANLLPDSDENYKKYNVSVQNHSYGTGIENYYGADAAAYDASTISNPSLLHIFSAGNSGDKTSAIGEYKDVNSYANLTGSFKMAKNIITVGATDSFSNISLLSSKGPAYDGRVRPELVAFGQDGSSGAAAIVSGTALLLQHAYKQQNGGQLPPSALIKSVLVNSADDVDGPGPDFRSGYGSINAYKAMQALVNKRYFTGNVSQDELQTFVLDIPFHVQQLKITICWNDPPAVANAQKTLVNDIDLHLLHAASGNSWQPWVLNSFPHVDSLKQPASRKKDSLNNIEQITLDQPLSGRYIIQVNGNNIPSGAQSYHISYQWDTINHFKWQYPTAADNLSGANRSTLRWASFFHTSPAKLHYSTDLGNNWRLIADSIYLNKGTYQWIAPDTFSTVMFKMMVGNQQFLSDTSTISSRLETGVGFNCTASSFIHWNKAPGISHYKVFGLRDKYLEALETTSDTAIILENTVITSYYAIAAVINGKPVINSYAFNINTQGIGCYIKSFIVDLVNMRTGSIKLELGTAYNIHDITIEKWSGNGFVSVVKFSDSLLQYSYVDNNLRQGGNSYRARINLRNGETIYSQTETIYYLPDVNYLVYPNPAKGSFNIASKNPDYSEMILYSATGQKLMTKKLVSTVQNISVRHLQPGAYFLIILENRKKVYQGTIIIQ